MEAIRKQASKLREQVAKQQLAVLKQLGHPVNEAVIPDEAEIQCHQKLQNLYNSTRSAKHFQKDIVRGVEGFITTSSKQMEIVRKLAEDCCRYGNENQGSDSSLARASCKFGISHSSMEKERENLLRVLGDQISEPLRALVTGAPLEDARHLTHRFEKIRQEVEAQAAEVLRRQSKLKEAGVPPESDAKFQNAEAKLSELKSAMMALGREATAAMSSVEAQQQRITLQKLFTMVDAERSFHKSVSAILEKLYAEMVLEKQHSESIFPPPSSVTDVDFPLPHSDTITNRSGDVPSAEKETYFVAEVIHPFDAQADGELSLFVGDYVVVRQVAPNGWSEGENEGKAGWFPSAYICRRDKSPTSMVIE
ncbi:SH3 domain-containing protein 1-like isoform X1 [Telopea speciosissima]|uniref:SH3 domain-containing protein 1-like isoform X1 n=1 Tax=Telopea speciosissima TaxID=54955 RepID=UPI001CC3710A|nr:SH3 domain-containing protein 1-like isoform X1 [Telopea speciosissima]